MELKCEGDNEMIKLAIRNTLSNALKFSNPDSAIDIKSRLNGKYVIVEIKDYGVGMTADELERLSSLQVVSKSGTSNEQGFGIGLYITRQFIDLNKGDIHFESQPGRGTLVTLSFPKIE